jgi:single-strand DNA-binding protein
MSNGVNRVTLIGRLGADPEIKFMPSGDCVANFTIATSESWKDKSGEKVEKTEWHRCVAFRKLGEIIGEYCKKGSHVYIEGKLRTRSYEKDGSKRYVTEVHADELRMLGNKDQHQGSRIPTAEPPQSHAAAGSGSYDAAGGYQDDIPFEPIRGLML